MRKNHAALLLVLALLSATCLTLPSWVSAAPRTIVVPRDFSTVYAALDNAEEGDTILIKNGIYHGAVNTSLTITKSISLVGEDPKNTIIVLHPRYGFTGGWNYLEPVNDYENAMAIEAARVNISGLSITADGGYIYAAGDYFHISHSLIDTPLLVNGLHQNISSNVVSKEILISGSHCVIAGNRVVGTKILVGYGSSNLIYNNTVVDGEGVDLFAVNYPSYGNAVFNNTMENCSVGITIRARGGNNTFYANTVKENDIGLRLENEGENTTYFHNNFINNKIQFLLEPQIQGYGYFDNGKEGNYWSDYVGNDTDRDGIGDAPYVIDETRRDNFPLMFPFDIENNTIVLPAEETETPPTTTLVTAAIVVFAMAVLAGAGLLLYLRRRQKGSGSR